MGNNKTIKVYYNKNIKMTPPKLASQVAHAVVGLGARPYKIVVLECRTSRLKAHSETLGSYSQYDLGFTEVDNGTLTAVAMIEE